MVMLLLMVVGAGIALLAFLAMRVPAITGEVNAWFGRTEVAGDPGEARLAQLTFALFLYTAPLGLGLLVYLLHFLVNWLSVVTEPTADDEQFRME